MAELVSSVVKYLTVKETNIDNLVFKLYYKFTFILLFASSVLLHLTQFFGDPITCNFGQEYAEDYCWIHGSPVFSYNYPKEGSEGLAKMGCVVGQPKEGEKWGTVEEEDKPTTSYYQWVSFMLALQAGSFILPYKFWKMMEGGLMKSFGTEGKLKVMIGDDEPEHIGGVLKTKALDKFVYYYLSTFHRNTSYFLKFVGCEFMNLILLIVNYQATDSFLNGNFASYGSDCLEFALLPADEAKYERDPFCATFPTVVRCDYEDVGAAGGYQNHDGLCILSQNIINQKVYLILWFWYNLLFCVSSAHLIFRVCTMLIQPLQQFLLEMRCYSRKKKEIKKTIRTIMAQCYIGDWFVLHQLSKNVNGHFFRAFLEELNNRMATSKKKSGVIV